MDGEMKRITRSWGEAGSYGEREKCVDAPGHALARSCQTWTAVACREKPSAVWKIVYAILLQSAASDAREFL